MKYITVILLSIMMASCASYPQHWGEIPEDISPVYNSPATPEHSNLAQITCAEGDREYYFLGTSKPSLGLRFTDEGFSFIKSFKPAWKVLPKERSFTLRWSFSDKYAEFKVRKFKFEPNTKYYAKYSAKQGQVKVWIEKEDGKVVYGKKPIEGQFQLNTLNANASPPLL